MSTPTLPLNVMTFNLRRRKPTDGPNVWDERRDAAVEVIRTYAPDVIGTQEGLPEQVDYLQAGLSDYGLVGEGRFGGRSDEFNAIYYRKDRLEVIDTGNFWLSDTPDVPGSRSWGNYVPRMATWAHFRCMETDRAYFHLNTHLDHLVPAARRKGAELIENRLPTNGTPTLITGDFNALPRGGTYRYLTSKRNGGPQFTDTLSIAQQKEGNRWNATYHHFTGRGLYRIDYIFARKAHRVLKHVVCRDRPDGKLPSDHFPVYAQLELAG